MYAVWHRDAALAAALVATGAAKATPCLLDGIWLARSDDEPMLSARDEAKRSGDAGVLAVMSR